MEYDSTKYSVYFRVKSFAEKTDGQTRVIYTNINKDMKINTEFFSTIPNLHNNCHLETQPKCGLSL